MTMPLQYSCFISFRHGDALLQSMVEQLEEALRGELQAATSKPIYIDRQVKVGDFYHQVLATALCQSACMVIVYVPTYFDADKSYCAREYHAMKSLEEKRLQLLGQATPQQGLIFPVVFRGLNSLPSELKDYRAYYDFTSFQLANRRLSKNPRFSPQITQMAEAIHIRCQALETLPDSAFEVCDQFALPDHADVVDWIKAVKRPQSPFPSL